MNRLSRRTSLALPVVLAASLLTFVSTGTASAGPSVDTPVVPSVPVAQQTRTGAQPEDLASLNALHGDQAPTANTVDGGGTDRATSLAPSASWTVSPETGDFTWSYPLRVPPSPGGLDPDLALSYQSSSVDGRTGATNNQASWVGDGWDLSAGFVERSYIPCANDTMGDVTPPKTAGDLCWRSDNATASYGGGGGELIRDDGTGEWRTRSDDGSRIQHVFGAGGVANGDDNGEYWRITSPDGTQYLFGSRPDAGSTWTVPVYGDDGGEPCHATGFDASHCVQAWRWNLDKVIDPNGNVIQYDYAPETNSYGMGGKDAAVSYVRGGTLKSVDYGLRDGTGQPATGQVVFATADRCVPGSDCRPEKKDNWPDVPWDDKCDTATCKDRHSPSFWSTRRLATITTKVRSGTGYADVESWSLDQQFPKSGDGEKPALWLKAINHTGLAGGTPVTLPPVSFAGKGFENRVLKRDGIGPLLRYRITAVISETGGITTVTYAEPDCVAGGPLPAKPEGNTMRCFPMKWAKQDFTEQTDWFQKYVVAKVTVSDGLSSSTEEQVSYEYLDGAGWAYDDSEFTKEDRRDWNVFRGYGRVRIRHGLANDPAGPISMTEQRFYRGMDTGKQPPVTVADSAGGSRVDSRWLAGTSFENQVHDGASERIVSKTILTPSVQGPTANRAGRTAYIVRPGRQTDYIALAAGGWRTTRLDQSYDDRGVLTESNDLGDTAVTTDDKCTTTYYKRNTDKWIINLAYEKRTVSVACTTTPKLPDDAVAANRYFYDGNPFKAPPTRGDVTRTEELDRWTGDDPVTTLVATTEYDAYGRTTSTTDAKGRTSTTAYTPDADHGGPLTQVVTTDAMKFATTTTIDPSFGQPTVSVDANGRRTETAYDALGRRTEVWLPNRTRGPNVRGNQYFEYAYHNDAPTVVTTTSLGPNGNYTSGKQIYDSLLRIRQKQEPAKDGGRLITDTRYDSQSRAYKTTAPYFNSAPVDDRIWIADDTDVPKWTLTEFDGAGRQKTVTVKGGTRDLWQGSYEYGGDRTTVIPPDGSTVTMGIVDAQGHTVEQRQFHGRTATGAFDSTTYTYTPSGDLASITDPAGQVWRRSYDLHGRQTVDENPDTGTSTFTYDEAGQLATRKDAKGTTLTYTYDDDGRVTEESQGTTTLAEWTYDTAPFGKGLPASATRYVDGYAYKSTVTGYNALSKPMGNTLTIPATPTEPSFAGTYTSLTAYKDDGSTRGVSYAAVPGLPAESVSYTYNDLGGLRTADGGYGGQTFHYVTDTQYTRYGEPERTQLGVDGKRVWLSRYYDANTRFLTRSIVDAELPQAMQADVNYTFDPSGNVTSVADDAPGQADTQCFRYDYLARLTEAWTPANGCTADPTVGALGGVAPYWQSFTYDKTGNRLTRTDHAAAGDTVQTSTYPQPGQPHAHQVSSVSTKGPGVDRTDEFGHDANGNVTKRGGQTLDWDAEGNLAKVTEGGRSTEFVYAADGSRLIRRDPTGATLYLGGQELRLTKATGAVTATRYYVYGGQTVAMRDSSGLTWLAADPQGTAQLAINSGSMQVVRRRQAPFGDARGAAVTFPGEKGFVGGTNDPSTGLVSLGERLYDPALGRFMSVDPELHRYDPQQMQGYTYADNNPVTNMDPTGRSFWSVVKGIARVTAFVASVLAIASGPWGWVAFGATVVDFAISRAQGDKEGATLAAFGLITFGLGRAAAGAAEGAEHVAGMATAANWMEAGANASDLVAVGPAVPGVYHTFQSHGEDGEPTYAAVQLTPDQELHRSDCLRATIDARNRQERESSAWNDGRNRGVAAKAAEAEAAQRQIDMVTAMGTDYWPTTDMAGMNNCYHVGVATAGAGSYPCGALGAILGKPRKAQKCTDLSCVGKGKGSYFVTRNSNLGNGTYRSHTNPVTGQPNPGEPTYSNPNQGGYYLTKNGDYRLTNGTGRAMS